MKDPTKQVEFSKVIMIFAMLNNTIVVIATLIFVLVTTNPSPLTILIPTVGAELASGSAFYYWKARTENKLKIALSNNVPVNETTVSSIIN